MIKRILYLPIETVVRDLDASLLVAHEALKHNFQVIIGEKAEVKRAAQRIGSGIYIYKHWEALFPYRFDTHERKNFFYVGFHQEGIVYIDNDTFLRRMTEKNRSNLLDRNYVKGEDQRRLLEEFDPSLQPILRVVGSPNFDLLREHYRPLFQRKADALKRTWGPFVLINTNFYPGNRKRHETENIIAERERSSLKNVGRPLTDAEKRVLVGSIEYKRRIYESYVAMLRRVAPQFPKVNFILRPHPSEDHFTWRSDLSGMHNVHVVFRDNVINWILAARAIIHTGCTTALEAWALKKPVIRYNPEQGQIPYESALPNAVGYSAPTLEELKTLLEKAIAGALPDTFDAQVEKVRSRIASIDGSMSVHRIFDDLKTVPVEHSTRSPASRAGWLSIVRAKAIRTASAYPALTRFLLGRDEAMRHAGLVQKFPGISKLHMRDMIATFAKLDGTSIPHIARIDADTFSLSA